jgi:superfamily II DNA/RNA helicase
MLLCSLILLISSLPVSALRGGIDVLVGTPGRILDLINRKDLDLSSLEHVVLDEVDRMLDMGFAEDVDQILQHRYSEGLIETNSSI